MNKSLKFLFLIGFLVFLLTATIASIIGVPESITFILAFAAAGVVMYLMSPEAK